MIEIWTEDSTAGYYFIKLINKTMYGNQLKVVKHHGIAEAAPTNELRHGGILYHLKRLKEDKDLIILYIDKAIDRSETADNYMNVVVESRKHKNVKIINQVCFELNMLSYSELFNITGNKNKDLKKIAEEFVYFGRNLRMFSPIYFSNELNTFIKVNCGKRGQYEHVAKVLLSMITNIDTIYNNERHKLSLIAGNKVGACWMKNCCVIPDRYICNRLCNIQFITLDNKVVNIVENSFLREQVIQINEIIDKYINSRYFASNIEKDKEYMDKYIKKYGNKSMIRNINKVLELYSCWNYERMYRVSK